MTNQRAEYAKNHRPMSYPLRDSLPPLPDRMKKLPVDERGYPVPWFVGWVEGKPDFRVVRPGGIAIAYKKNLCWICGDYMGTHKALVIGPMCAVNRVTSEPASHLECAQFAVKACPFLTLPQAKYRQANMPEHNKAAGVPLSRNPGVSVIWVTLHYVPFKVGTGYLFKLSAPVQLEWWREGRVATRAECYTSMRGGMPALIEAAELDSNPKQSIADLTKQYGAALSLLPPGEAVPGLDMPLSAPPVPGASPPDPRAGPSAR